MARAFDVAAVTEEADAARGPAIRPAAASRRERPPLAAAAATVGPLPSVRPDTPGFDTFLARADGAMRARVLLQLQHTRGNRYVQRLIQRQAASAAPRPGARRAPRPAAVVIQRNPDDDTAAATAGGGPTGTSSATPQDASSGTPAGGGTTSITEGRASYAVTGTTLKAAATQIRSRTVAGTTTWRPAYSVTPDDQGKVTAATVTVAVTVTMPTWPAAATLPAPDKAKWDAAMQALEVHEQGHVSLVHEKLGTLGESLVGKTKAEAATALKTALTDLQTASDAYDTRTDHGRNQGVVIDTGDDAAQSTSTEGSATGEPGQGAAQGTAAAGAEATAEPTT